MSDLTDLHLLTVNQKQKTINEQAERIRELEAENKYLVIRHGLLQETVNAQVRQIRDLSRRLEEELAEKEQILTRAQKAERRTEELASQRTAQSYAFAAERVRWENRLAERDTTLVDLNQSLKEALERIAELEREAKPDHVTQFDRTGIPTTDQPFVTDEEKDS